MTAISQVKQSHIRRWLLDSSIILSYAFLIGFSAQLRVPLSFSPVPITAQTLTILLAGMLLGPKRGGLAGLTYLVMGTLGWLPFAGGSLLGPTGGYLIGFIAAIYFIGITTAWGWTKRWWSTLFVLLAGNCIIYLFGIPWLSQYVGWHSVFVLGLYPFIIGDLLKIVCTFGMMRVLYPDRRIHNIFV